ncbi:MAG TPA: PEP/pyruvate-binding domain-containing protein, partial [Gemmatales bacterium]|nr:PEP/pyruvate-binding domain-containing protein [Gemmatales bacterium]
MSRYIRWFSDLSIADVALVGGKNASLGEMYRKLTPKGIAIPNGFAVTAEGYRSFVKEGQLGDVLKRYLAGLDTSNLADLAERGRKIRDAILNTPLSEELQTSITQAYQQLGREYGSDPDVAVRSSATAEDLPGASFAGQQESFLNIRGDRALLDACRQCLASLFTDRAISYRVDKGFDHFAVALSIGVQKMVRSDMACSGVLFTLDTESGFPDVVLINSAYGLGETIVKGRVDPDEFLVFKPMLERANLKPILKRRVGSKQEKMIYASRGGKSTRIVAVPQEQQQRLSLSDDEVLTLARWGCLIEKHYSQKSDHPVPMDIEWAKDGQTG